MAGRQIDEPAWIGFASAVALHDEAIATFGGLGGFPNPHYLEAALDAPKNTLVYSDGGLDLFDLAAVYLYHIAKAHAFTDGNKRTAYLTALTFLEVNGIQILHPANSIELAQEVEAAAKTNTLEKSPLAALMREMAGRTPPRRKSRKPRAFRRRK